MVRRVTGEARGQEKSIFEVLENCSFFFDFLGKLMKSQGKVVKSQREVMKSQGEVMKSQGQVMKSQGNVMKS